MPSPSTAVRRLVLAACLLSGSILRAAEPTIVATRYPPVEQSTFHQLQFADADMAVLKNVYLGGSLLTMTPRVEDQRLAIEPGDVSIQPLGLTRTLRNTDTTPIEIIEVELK